MPFEVTTARRMINVGIKYYYYEHSTDFIFGELLFFRLFIIQTFRVLGTGVGGERRKTTLFPYRPGNEKTLKCIIFLFFSNFYGPARIAVMIINYIIP